MHASQPLPQTPLLSQRAYEQNVHDVEMENIHDRSFVSLQKAISASIYPET